MALPTKETNMSISKATADLFRFVLNSRTSTASEKAMASAALDDKGDDDEGRIPEMLGGKSTPWQPNSGTPRFLDGTSPTAAPASSARNPNVTAPRTRGVTSTPTVIDEKADLDRLMGMAPDRDRPQFERTAGGELVTRYRTSAQRADRSVAFGPGTSLRGVIQRSDR
jgi:hypothetical protein